VYFKTIRRFIKNMSYSEAFGVYRCSEAFPVVFFLFVRNNKSTSDWQTEVWQTWNNSKTHYFTWDFQLIFKHQLSSSSLKSLWRFVINVMYSEVNVVYVKAYCFDLIEMKFDLFLELHCLARDQNLPKSMICQRDSTQGWKSDDSKINKCLDFVKKKFRFFAV